MTQVPRSFKAWLVTWEWVGNHAEREDKIVAVLDPRLSRARVRELVELLYLNISYGVSERVYYALHRKKNPYPASCTDGRTVHCGDNPFLMAHLVENLMVERHDDGTETATWKNMGSKRRHKFTTKRIG